MKYLSDYQKNKQSAAFDKFGAFFAFSQEQLDDKKKDGIRYASLGCGLIAPVYEAANLSHALGAIYQDAIKQDLAENGIKAIIHRELANHECQITSDYSEIVSILACYGITEDQINNEWSEFFQKCIDNDWF